MLVDTHIHLTHASLDGTFPCIVSEENQERIAYYDRKQLIEAMQKENISLCVEPGIDLASNEKLLELAKHYPGFLYPAVGVHPTRAPHTRWKDRKVIERLAANEKVVAIGELGLDYHYERPKQHRFKQKCWFVWQLKLAWKYRLPLVLHIRLADEDAIRILRKYRKKITGGVCHCFNRGTDAAKVYTRELGLMLGIGGSLLQDDCSELRQAVIDTPLEYLVLETDGPYVKPQRPDTITGKKWQKARNSSLILPDVAKKVAELKGIDIGEVERVTTDNAKRLFGI